MLAITVQQVKGCIGFAACAGTMLGGFGSSVVGQGWDNFDFEKQALERAMWPGFGCWAGRAIAADA